MIISRIKFDNLQWIFQLFDQYRIFYGQPSDVAGAKNYLTERLEKEDAIVFAAFTNGGEKTAVGFALLYPLFSSISMTRNWILNDLFVEPGRRDSGIGTRLIHAAADMAKDSGAVFLQLETAAGNIDAQRLYESLGFVRQPDDGGFYFYRLSLC